MSYPISSSHKTQNFDPNTFIDLRSDTVTQPDDAMREAMAKAKVGDDVYGEDPSVNALQNRLAEMAGKDAGLFFPTGTQSNLAAVLSWCGRGEEILVGRDYHIFCAEAAGVSVLGGIAMDPLPLLDDGSICLDHLKVSIKPDDNHCPITRLLCLENTVTGRALSPQKIGEAANLAKSFGLNIHLDGARIFNAVVAYNTTLKTMCEQVDSLSICLSKGIGIPAGSVLVGPKNMIAKAHRLRKMLGGGMRQAGVLAAAGLHALEHNMNHLHTDHIRAQELKAVIEDSPFFSIMDRGFQTNMVNVNFENCSGSWVESELLAKGVRVSPGATSMRLVLHRDISDEQFHTLKQAFSGLS